ncbi:MAG: triose-phosphate isomerase [Spirochaetota bacterium]|nr:triose-phosphate isomerase [Spirochaetota bacterium]
MGRRMIFAGNWKMNKCFQEAIELTNDIISGLDDIGEREVIIFPPSIYVKEIIDKCKNTIVEVGVQNIYYKKEGAFTGEISPMMVKDVGAKYVLIGHSERRHVFGETNDDVERKVKAAFEYNLNPILCVGELLEDREKGLSDDVVKKQVQEALKDISEENIQNLIIAYEPVWAIGTGKVATPEIAESMHHFIRKTLMNLYNDKLAQEIPILYGGSVSPDNIKGLYSMNEIDGVLVGGASLKSKSFLDIIHVDR